MTAHCTLVVMVINTVGLQGTTRVPYKPHNNKIHSVQGTDTQFGPEPTAGLVILLRKSSMNLLCAYGPTRYSRDLGPRLPCCSVVPGGFESNVGLTWFM